jgi:hypothetical protein
MKIPRRLSIGDCNESASLKVLVAVYLLILTTRFARHGSMLNANSSSEADGSGVLLSFSSLILR